LRSRVSAVTACVLVMFVTEELSHTECARSVPSRGIVTGFSHFELIERVPLRLTPREQAARQRFIVLRSAARTSATDTQPTRTASGRTTSRATEYPARTEHGRIRAWRTNSRPTHARVAKPALRLANCIVGFVH